MLYYIEKILMVMILLILLKFRIEEKGKDLDFNKIDERLAAGRYVLSKQRERYLKSIFKDIKG